MMTVHVIGATGRSGQAVCRALVARGGAVVAVVRDAVKWEAAGIAGAVRVAELEGAGLGEALNDAQFVVSCAHARHIPAILQSAPVEAQFVFLGSTRKFTRWPDAHGNGVLAGERTFQASGRCGVLLHPTMIYGAEGENNVQRLAALMRRLPVVPLPGGGRALVQPIYQTDVTRSVLAALEVTWTAPESLVIAGPEPLPYAVFVRAIAAAAGLGVPRIVKVSPGLLRLAGLITWLPGLPRVGRDEIRRLLEDKAFDIGTMRSRLGVDPIPLSQGLALTFRHTACPDQLLPRTG